MVLDSTESHRTFYHSVALNEQVGSRSERLTARATIVCRTCWHRKDSMNMPMR
jgi:hypothetical protein